MMVLLNRFRKIVVLEKTNDLLVESFRMSEYRSVVTIIGVAVNILVRSKLVKQHIQSLNNSEIAKNQGENRGKDFGGFETGFSRINYR